MVSQSKYICFLLGMQASPTAAWVIGYTPEGSSLNIRGQPLQAATNDIDTVAATSRRGFFAQASIAATAAAAPLIAWAEDDAAYESSTDAGEDSVSPLQDGKGEVTIAQEIPSDAEEIKKVEEGAKELIAEKEEVKEGAKEQKLIAQDSSAAEEIKKVEEETKELIAELEKDAEDEVEEETQEQKLITRLEEQQDSKAKPTKAQEEETKKFITQLEKAQEKVEEEITQLVELIEQVEADAEKAQSALLPETADFVDRLKDRSVANDEYLAKLKEQMEPDVDTNKKGLLSFLKIRSKGNEEFRENYEWFLARMKSRFSN